MVRWLVIHAACFSLFVLVSSCGAVNHNIGQNGGNDQSNVSTIKITAPNNGISFRTKEKDSVTISGICEKGSTVNLVTTPSRPVTNNCATDGTWSFESGVLSSGPNTF